MLTISDCWRYLDELKENIPSEWLSKEFGKITKYYKTEKNTRVLGPIENFVKPLAYLIYQAEKNLSRIKLDSSITLTNETVDLTRIGLYLEILKNNNVVGLSEKLNDLTNADKNTFEKIINELDIASSFAKSNHKVEFIPTKSEEQQKTPDLLIDNNIEVECKKKDRESKRDKANNQLWNSLIIKLFNLMESKEKNYFIYIITENDPVEDSLNQLYSHLEKSISRDSEQPRQLAS